VRAFRKDHGIAVYREGERAERGELTLLEAATELGTCRMTVLRLIGAGTLKARQACKGAPRVIKAQEAVKNARGRPLIIS
jgi:hypothetical protein